MTFRLPTRRQIAAVLLLAVSAFVLLTWSPATAFAQDGGVLEALTSNGPPWLVALPALVVAILAYVMAVVPDDKMPPAVAAILNAIAGNFGAARNDPARNTAATPLLPIGIDDDDAGRS